MFLLTGTKAEEGKMKKFKQILIIINLKTIVVTSLAVASTYLCRRFDDHR